MTCAEAQLVGTSLRPQTASKGEVAVYGGSRDHSCQGLTSAGSQDCPGPGLPSFLKVHIKPFFSQRKNCSRFLSLARFQEKSLARLSIAIFRESTFFKRNIKAFKIQLPRDITGSLFFLLTKLFWSLLRFYISPTFFPLPDKFEP